MLPPAVRITSVANSFSRFAVHAVTKYIGEWW